MYYTISIPYNRMTMVRFLLRNLWRGLILLIGITLVLAVIKAYPYMHAQLPTFVIFLLLYIFFAYVGIPTLIRLLRIVIKPNHIPLYVTTSDGWPSDPVNIALIVNDRRHLIKAMKDAGWIVADPLTIKSGLRELASIIFNTSYASAPLSHLYLFNRPQDIGFEISTNTNRSARTRHHVRFWRLEEPPLDRHDALHIRHYTFWAKKFEHLLFGKKEMWVGAATEETYAVAIQWRTGQLTHGGSHESDKERDFIIASLRKQESISHVYTSKPGKALRFRGQQIHTFYVSNGSIKIARLRPKK